MRRLLSLLIPLVILVTACTTASGPTDSTPSPENDQQLASNGAESAATFKPPFKPPAGSLQLSAQNCPDEAKHIYHPFRLYLLAGCSQHAVLGVIEQQRSEADGDYHILFKVDSDSRDPHSGFWINDKNVTAQHGMLVLEPTCEHTVTQKDAMAACLGYHNPIAIPSPGVHVVALGYWVFDADHGWNELHEVTQFAPAPSAP